MYHKDVIHVADRGGGVVSRDQVTWSLLRVILLWPGCVFAFLQSPCEYPVVALVTDQWSLTDL